VWAVAVIVVLAILLVAAIAAFVAVFIKGRAGGAKAPNPYGGF